MIVFLVGTLSSGGATCNGCRQWGVWFPRIRKGKTCDCVVLIENSTTIQRPGNVRLYCMRTLTRYSQINYMDQCITK